MKLPKRDPNMAALTKINKVIGKSWFLFLGQIKAIPRTRMHRYDLYNNERVCPVRARFKILRKQKSGKTKSTMKFVRSNLKKDCSV